MMALLKIAAIGALVVFGLLMLLPNYSNRLPLSSFDKESFINGQFGLIPLGDLKSANINSFITNNETNNQEQPKPKQNQKKQTIERDLGNTKIKIETSHESSTDAGGTNINNSSTSISQDESTSVGSSSSTSISQSHSNVASGESHGFTSNIVTKDGQILYQSFDPF